MPSRSKRKSLKSLARDMAARRSRETPEKRAARLETMRNYARFARQNETEAQREERLQSMRVYSRRVRAQQRSEKRKQNVTMVIERCKEMQESEPITELEPLCFVTVELEIDDKQLVVSS